MGKKKRRPRIKILPDKAFRKIWDKANSGVTLEEYIRIFTDSSADKPYVDFEKYYIDYIESLDLLKAVYESAQLSFSDILEKSEKRKAEISDMFCIPIRTVEEWYSGKNRCSSYIRLMLLKQFHLLSLGSKYVKLESEIIYLSSMPSIYERHERSEGEISDSGDDGGIIEQYPLYGGLERRKTERSEEDKEFFRKYGFYPDRNIIW